MNRDVSVGLLRPEWATDEARAVLDAVADELCDYSLGEPVGRDLAAAVAAYVASLDGTREGAA